MIVDVLGRITGDVRKALEAGYYGDFADAHKAPTTPRPSLKDAVKAASPWALLAEVKPSSPSAGDLSGGDGVAKARRQLELYRGYGVTGISVLTERDTFGGSLELLREAATAPPVAPEAHPVPVLMKDFVIHPDQLDAAASAGASAVLLIHQLFARGHTEFELPDAIAAAHQRGLEVLLEVDDGRSFEQAAATEADLLGINNRDLRTLEMDTERAIDVVRHRAHLVADRPVLALSGIETRADVEANHQGGLSGVLVGTSLMSARDPRRQLRQLRDIVHVKVCGTGHPEDDEDVHTALGLADAAGVVVAAGGTRRERSPDEARALFGRLPQGVERVMVTTCHDGARLDELVSATGAHTVQIHDECDVETLRGVRSALANETRLVALVRIPEAVDPHEGAASVRARLIQAVEERAELVDRILFDSTPRAGEEPGGTGHRVDTDTAAAVVRAHPDLKIVLAGGLTPDNVATVIRRVKPWGVDVSSGVEARAMKGRKVPDKVRSFVSAARTVAAIHHPDTGTPALRVH